LLEREWIRVVGHRDVPGKPGLYATTKEFLDYFNLKSLEELPTLSEIRDLDKINAELEFPLPDVDEAQARDEALLNKDYTEEENSEAENPDANSEAEQEDIVAESVDDTDDEVAEEITDENDVVAASESTAAEDSMDEESITTDAAETETTEEDLTEDVNSSASENDVTENEDQQEEVRLEDKQDENDMMYASGDEPFAASAIEEPDEQIEAISESSENITPVST
jgi:segregation and condensation protein B